MNNNYWYENLPEKKVFDKSIRRAPKRESNLTIKEKKLAIKNALRYIKPENHKIMANEFYEELEKTGRIYGYRFRPEGKIYAKPIEEYKGKCIEGKAIQLMIDNNLDFNVGLYPYELVTYGETGQVCQNWMQYNLIKKYLEELNDDETLIVESGHPLGIFKSDKNLPRVILSNALIIGKYNNNENWNRLSALGVSNYGQFTAGGWFYIGPQGIVHGTYSTLLSVARQKFNRNNEDLLKGLLFVSAGLGGMSGAQGKACSIAKGVSIIAEVDKSKIEKKIEQKWIDEYVTTPKEAFKRALDYIKNKISKSIAFNGNIIDLLQYAVDNKIKIDILTDQTSCHVRYEGGYCPVGLTFEERTNLLDKNKNEFRKRVDSSLKMHYELIEKLRKTGTYFFDYGNSFTTSLYEIGIKEICVNGKNELDGFIYKSFVEEFLGPNLFDYGYGPFRWVCLSGKKEDLDITDNAAANCINKNRRYQDYDNYVWIKNAKEYNLVVGSQARILYQDAETRRKIAKIFNNLVKEGKIGPVIIGRDHMDTGGVDAPSRETSNIKDGSNLTADMSALVFGGDCAMGMSLVSIHNGGGTGIGNSQSCGYGLILDGSDKINDIIDRGILFDVLCGVSRRAWARNINSINLLNSYDDNVDYKFSLPNICEDDIIDSLF
ncbi:urocanate hydratase [Fusobacterium nucleatum]|uniref:urocanate hydratase n=1 Tax=Fusobacterium nucleatum TaxID=851 RepID=UPI0025F5F73A|nr:urocanate hydratase [uncultured Fusobacterium sp.]